LLAPECKLIQNGDDNSYAHFCHATVVAAQAIPNGHFDVIQARRQLEIVHSVVEVRSKPATDYLIFIVLEEKPYSTILAWDFYQCPHVSLKGAYTVEVYMK